jgi:ArsR family transcriptional regulator
MAKRSRPQGCCAIKVVRPLPRARSRRLAEIFKALADPTRLDILRVIVTQSGPVCACDIVEQFDLSQPTISHHLKVLRDAGLLSSRRSGLWSIYEPDPEGLERLADLPALIAGR